MNADFFEWKICFLPFFGTFDRIHFAVGAIARFVDVGEGARPQDAVVVKRIGKHDGRKCIVFGIERRISFAIHTVIVRSI